MIPDTVLRQVLDGLVPDRWNSRPIAHAPKPKAREVLWRRKNKALLSLRLVCKQWDLMVSDILSRKVDFHAVSHWSDPPADTILWFVASMARSNSFPSCRVLEHTRRAVQSIRSSVSLQEGELWRAPFATQMAYHGKWDARCQLLDHPTRRSPKTTAAYYLPVLIYCGASDLQDEINSQEDINAVDEFFGRALFAGVSKGDMQLTSTLLAAGADVNATGGVFHTVLQLASSQGSTDLMRLLLEAGAKANEEGGQYGTALLAATYCSQQPAFELLLAHGASPHIAPEIYLPKYGKERRSPLIVASEHGDARLVGRLLQIEDIDINFTCGLSRDTALSLALDMGHEDIAERLASDSRIDNQYALRIAALAGNLKIIRLLVEQKGIHPHSVDGGGQAAVMSALKSNSDETATYLLGTCSFDDPNCPTASEKSAIDIAAQSGLEGAARILLEKGADLSKDSEGVCLSLQLAARKGHAHVVELLLEYGADPTVPPEQWPPLTEAAANGHGSVVKVLLSQPGVDVNHRSERDMTPLLAAAFSGHHEVVRIILDSGGEINARHGFGATALSMAAACGYTDVVRLLLSYGAKIDMESATGDTGLPAAVRYEHIDIAEMLLSHGVSANSPDPRRGAPLYSAVKNRHEDMVKLLLRSLDIELDPKGPMNGLTPLELAQKEGYEEIVALLLQRGAGQPKLWPKPALQDRTVSSSKL